MREAKFFNDDELRRQFLVTTQKFGLIARACPVAREDKGIPPDLQRWMALQNNPPDLATLINGADHMFMISKTRKALQLFAPNCCAVDESCF